MEPELRMLSTATLLPASAKSWQACTVELYRSVRYKAPTYYAVLESLQMTIITVSVGRW